MRKIDVDKTTTTERGSVTTIIRFENVGYNIHDGRPVYEKIVTKFSIAKGIMKNDERTGIYCDVDGVAHIHAFNDWHSNYNTSRVFIERG